MTDDQIYRDDVAAVLLMQQIDPSDTLLGLASSWSRVADPRCQERQNAVASAR
jgi:hypothetical protein